MFNLRSLTDLYSPSLVFLSEPQTFQSDIARYMDYFRGQYSFFLNSEDLHDLDIPLLSNRAKGGTLVMWEASLDPFVSVHASDTSAFWPIVLQIPNTKTSIHVALYLPTAGQDTAYLAELAKMRVSLDELLL